MWLKVKQFAKKHGITEQSVRGRIQAGTIQNKKIKGIINVWDDAPEPEPQEKTSAEQELADLQYSLAMKDSKQLQNELKREKLKNLQQDTLIKKQKQTYTKEKYRQEYAEGVFECFTAAFADVKTKLISMKLKKQQMQEFQTIFKKCIKKFQVELKKYLADADKKEIEDNEDNEK